MTQRTNSVIVDCFSMKGPHNVPLRPKTGPRAGGALARGASGAVWGGRQRKVAHNVQPSRQRARDGDPLSLALSPCGGEGNKHATRFPSPPQGQKGCRWRNRQRTHVRLGRHSIRKPVSRGLFIRIRTENSVLFPDNRHEEFPSRARNAGGTCVFVHRARARGFQSPDLFPDTRDVTPSRRRPNSRSVRGASRS